MPLLSAEYFDLLLATPLFQGMGRLDVQEIVSQLRLTMVECHQRCVLAHADAPCDHLVLVLRGRVAFITAAIDNSYRMTETLSAPLPIQVAHLFGRRMTYSSTFVAATDCTILSLTKHDVLTLYNTYEVFRLNLLNMLVMQLQRATYRLWTGTHGSLRRRIVQFVMHHCAYPAGEKQLYITMNTLAAILGVPRRHLSRELNSLQADGLLLLRRGAIVIPAMEDLYAAATV